MDERGCWDSWVFFGCSARILIPWKGPLKDDADEYHGLVHGVILMEQHAWHCMH